MELDLGLSRFGDHVERGDPGGSLLRNFDPDPVPPRGERSALRLKILPVGDIGDPDARRGARAERAVKHRRPRRVIGIDQEFPLRIAERAPLVRRGDLILFVFVEIKPGEFRRADGKHAGKNQSQKILHQSGSP